MSVYVDGIASYDELGKWSHMIADTSEELHAMAENIGLEPDWCQRPGTYLEHYDLRESKRQKAIDAGALAVSSRELVVVTSRKRAAMSRAGSQADGGDARDS